MDAARNLLVGTLLLVSAFTTNAVAQDAQSKKESQGVSSFDRFRPGSSYSASGYGATDNTTSSPAFIKGKIASQSASLKRTASGPSGTRHQNQAAPTFQRELKPALTNELRVTPSSFQSMDNQTSKASSLELPHFDPASGSNNLAQSDDPTDKSSTKVDLDLPLAAKAPSQTTSNLIVNELEKALASEAVKPLKTLPVPVDATRPMAEQPEIITAAGMPLSNKPGKHSTSAAEAESTADTDTRKLNFDSEAVSSSSEPMKSPFNEIVSWRPSTNSIVTTVSGLGMVLGLLLVASWIARKSMPRSARVLPNEVAEVLGRVVLSNRQTAQLLKLGNKLILVSVSSDGAETLTEIEDPEEVQRLLQLSEEASGRGSNAEFERVFQQLANGPAAEGFLGEEAPEYDDPRFQDNRQQDPNSVHYDAHRLAAAYANTPGGRSHAA